jgi:hypothetical protein
MLATGRFQLHLFARMRQKEGSQPGAVGLVALMEDNGPHPQPSIFEGFHNPTDDLSVLRLDFWSLLNLGALRKARKWNHQNSYQSNCWDRFLEQYILAIPFAVTAWDLHLLPDGHHSAKTSQQLAWSRYRQHFPPIESLLYNAIAYPFGMENSASRRSKGRSRDLRKLFMGGKKILAIKRMLQ